MKEKVFLQFKDNVPFTSYQLVSFEFAILSPHNNIYPFMYHHFINLFMDCTGTKDTIFTFTHLKDAWFAQEDVFEDEPPIRISQEIRVCEDAFIEAIKFFIRHGRYLSGLFDEFYISSRNAFEKYHFQHEFYLYGFDDADQVFYAFGYTKNRKLETHTIPYHEFYLSIFKAGLRWVKPKCPNPKFQYSFDVKACYKELYEYLNNAYTGPKMNTETELYGIQIQDKFLEYAKKQVEEKGYLDVRYSRFFSEYKSFMQERLKFLFENRYVQKDYSLEYEKAVKNLKTVHLLFIKYDITQNQMIGNNIGRLLSEAQEIETRILRIVLQELQGYIDNIQ